MADEIIDIGSGMWNIRGSFRVSGLINVGTHCSLIALPSGEYVFLDSYKLTPAIRAQVDRLTDGGEKVSAIVNLHPFHTVHCEWMHSAFPKAKLYGTQRHRDQLPGLPWDEVLCESAALADLFGDVLDFSVPGGVKLVTDNENVHFSSVLAYHKPSRTIHVDDTLSCLALPGPLSLLPVSGRLDFHMTLAKALEPRAGAADDFHRWAVDLGIGWNDVKTIATAHNSLVELEEDTFPELLGEALGRIKPVLDQHRAKFG